MSVDTALRVYASVTGRTAIFTTPDGVDQAVTASPGDDIRHLIIQRAAAEARHAASVVELITSGDQGDYHLVVDARGGVTSSTTHRTIPREHLPEPMRAVPGFEKTSQGKEVSTLAQEQEALGRSETPAPEPLPTESQPRPSFITTATSAETTLTGWRGFLSSLGLMVGASRAATKRLDAQRLVSQRWAGCRTAAVVNGKGGVGKTMTTAMIAAVFARSGGGNVLAWDNNDTRGTLGWRTEQGLYDTTVCDLLPAASDLLAPTAGISDIARFVHHQSVDRYDVLRSNPELLAAHQRIEHSEFDTLMQVAARYYRLVFFDSGNDESAQRWLRMIDSSYQLVIPTLAAPESAESAALLLDALRERDERSRALADNAVVVVTQSEPTGSAAARRIADAFRGTVRAVHSIPFDPALKSGPLRFDSLRRTTQDAWLHAAAAVAGGF
ncbi:MinD/ParA family ATP-binding protein [Microbacterium sp. CPCC 204701]|uniref:MinD/ParA family ATP-binding protein n=1 Tax=Microbacterium sp. CPCC 204701 TaxID=2493084 RepID=UPI000FD8CD5F|nr:AAA family ATPase [Microbacterium sp. CPCC 204701]